MSSIFEDKETAYQIIKVLKTFDLELGQIIDNGDFCYIRKNSMTHTTSLMFKFKSIEFSIANIFYSGSDYTSNNKVNIHHNYEYILYNNLSNKIQINLLSNGSKNLSLPLSTDTIEELCFNCSLISNKNIEHHLKFMNYARQSGANFSFSFFDRISVLGYTGTDVLNTLYELRNSYYEKQ